MARRTRPAIAETISSDEEVDDELEHLLGVLAPWARPPD